MAIKEETKQASGNDNTTNATKSKELKTEGPLSEKDEVKQAEQNMQKQQNKGR
jgi:hypothetical protein